MTSSQTGSKLADSLRRAKTQQGADDSASTDAMPAPTPAPASKAPAPAKARARSRAKTSKPSFVLSSRCWPD